MNKIKINYNQLNKNNINSAIFLEYIKLHGFNPDNYNGILELIQSVRGSMSQFLKGHNHYLLSRKVNYGDLNVFKVKGAFGSLEENGIIIPKSIYDADSSLYTEVKKVYNKTGNNHPRINHFDVIIANGDSIQLGNVANFDMDKYIGFCMDKDDSNLVLSLEWYRYLLNLINSKSRDQYVLEYDTISSKDKQLCLIKKK